MSTTWERSDHGPITFYSISRNVPGARPLRVGIYIVDGVMIDTGPRKARAAIDAILAEHQIDEVLLTHHHEDHTGNAAYVAEKLGVTPWIHPAGQQLAKDAEQLPFYRRVYWGQHRGVATRPLGEEFVTSGSTFRIVHTPGHAPDHVVLYEAERNWLFGGDLYLTDRVTRGFDYEDVSEMIASIRTVLAFPDGELFCQHTGRYSSHQHQLGKKLDRMLGLRNKAIVHLEEGRSLKEIARALGIADRGHKWLSGGEWSAEHLVRGLLRDAGRLD